MVFSYINIFTSSTNPINIILINIFEYFSTKSALKKKYNINEISDFCGIPAFILRYDIISLSNIKEIFLSDKKPFIQQTIYSGIFFKKKYIYI